MACWTFRTLQEFDKQRAKPPAQKKPKADVSPAIKFLHDRYIGRDSAQQAAMEEHEANAEVAQQVYDLRSKAGLSQRALAKRVGTTASVICRLEDADYDGHTLSMLRRIAAALNKRVVITFLPAKRELQAK